MIRNAFLLLMAFCVLVGGAVVAYGDDPNDPGTMDQKVVKILRTTNKAQINRFVPKVYELKHVNPNMILFWVRRAVALEEGLIDSFVTPDGDSGCLLVVVPEYQIPAIDKVVAELDRPGLTPSSGTKWSWIQLRHRAVPDACVPQCLLQYGAADNSIRPDLEQNAVFIMGAPTGTDAILAGAACYDLPTPQVSVSARIYEVDVRTARAARCSPSAPSASTRRSATATASATASCSTPAPEHGACRSVV